MIYGASIISLFVGSIGAITLLVNYFPSPNSASKPKEANVSVPTEDTVEPEETKQPEPANNVVAVSNSKRLYRQAELNRIAASLLANSSILVAGEEGSGKSYLANTIVEKLSMDGFTVAFCEPATPKQMLTEIAEQLGVETRNLEGKSLTADRLQLAIADYFECNTAFLVIDDAHLCEPKFRIWLKSLKRQGVPMLLLATDPPKSDVFINLPRIELSPLPEYAIRELMEQAALERGVNLKPSDLAKLQERAGGNPMLAIRAIEEEYLGLDIEAGDHRRYWDITPLILIAGVSFTVMRFVGLGTNNPSLYMFCGIGAVIFMGLSRLLYNLPGESRRIR